MGGDRTRRQPRTSRRLHTAAELANRPAPLVGGLGRHGPTTGLQTAPSADTSRPETTNQLGPPGNRLRATLSSRSPPARRISPFECRLDGGGVGCRHVAEDVADYGPSITRSRCAPPTP